MTPSTVHVRHRLLVRGVVQGVGFRPFVHRLAARLELAGHVGNDTRGVFLEVEGPHARVAVFERDLVASAPPLAQVDSVDCEPIAVLGEVGFRIVASRRDADVAAFVAPDAAVCDDCLRELFDPADRRYRYPFATCTNCGPRFTITLRLPYDRPNTTMAGFELCRACAREYHDPTDRRFHAQPLACADCGPRVWFEGPDGRVDGSDAALAAAQRSLAAGEIVAVKGLGGYHLACDPRSDAAVAELRRRKGRADKPLALMVRDLDAVGRLAEVSPDEQELLASSARPIVLLVRRDEAGTELSALIAPGNPLIGLMLPYTPLHHLLLEAGVGPDALVMTSGNLTEEPIAYDDEDARRRLGAIARCWLVHDRPIHVPCDDSVLRLVGGDAGRAIPIRRSRGFAPLPVTLPQPAPPLLAVGGELKTTFCLASGTRAWMSQHIGDMGSLETLAAFERSVRQFGAMYGIEPAQLAADLHPGNQTRQWAERQLVAPLQLVQHHHAHVAAVMAEHGVPAGRTVIGVAFDGTGYGTDGAIWGGEVLLASYAGFDRAAHLAYVPLPGGDAAIRKPFRAALAHLWAAGIEWDPDLAPVAAASADELAVLRRQLERNVHSVPTSSMGRLFDAVSSLLGLRHEVSYEAQAAMELEALAATGLHQARPYRFERTGRQFDAAPVLRAVIADLRAGQDAAAIAAGFHQAVAWLVAAVAVGLRADCGVDRAALSGGVFQNALLLRLTTDALGDAGFEVLTHRLVPPNDGGLALGQVAVVAGSC